MNRTRRCGVHTQQTGQWAVAVDSGQTYRSLMNCDMAQNLYCIHEVKICHEEMAKNVLMARGLKAFVVS
jgi:hypothetical protein